MSVNKTPSGLKNIFKKYPPLVLASHWFFQSLLYMERTERIFKLVIDGALTSILWWLIHAWVSGWLGIVIAFGLAHTLNFLFNAHLWNSLRFFGKSQYTYIQYLQYVQELRLRARNQPSILKVLLYGSLVRDQWTLSSDLDVRFIRRKGFMNGILACSYAALERTRALFTRFPLDLYVIDDERSLSKMRPDEKPIDLESGDSLN